MLGAGIDASLGAGGRWPRPTLAGGGSRRLPGVGVEGESSYGRLCEMVDRLVGWLAGVWGS